MTVFDLFLHQRWRKKFSHVKVKVANSTLTIRIDKKIINPPMIGGFIFSTNHNSYYLT